MHEITAVDRQLFVNGSTQTNYLSMEQPACFSTLKHIISD